MIAKHAGASIVKISHPKTRKPWELELPIKIIGVEVVGKNLFIDLEDGSVIYNHMLMWGAWRPSCELYGRKRLNTCFKTSKGCLGYFGGGVLKLIRGDEAKKLKSKLGPDIIQSEDVSALTKLHKSKREIGPALLAQELVSGVGNIYKSEALFACRISPFRPANSLTSTELKKLYNWLHKQMTGDVTRPGINTTPPNLIKKGIKRFVYRRFHQPCLLCGTRIERVYQGEGSGRSTYFCPTCQKVDLSSLPSL